MKVPRPRSSKQARSGAWAKLIPQNARALVELLPDGDAPRKRPRDVAALFVDIQGCTRLCEDLPAAEMNKVIERYFSVYLDVVRRVGGDVTEVLGDGLLALFEGSDLRENAHAAFEVALEIQARTRRLNDRRRRRHDPITVNIGLNAGRALVGFTRLRGRSGERWVYAATGPVTNVAARLCALATGGQILTTRAAAGLLPAECDCRSLGRHSLRNVTGLVEVVEIRLARNHGGGVETEGRGVRDG
ncbi:MAG: adenylate/guanylate cyclase domain-containing protein [candidate division NC10 bacterium]|nr:adenylate/guanylate cyclase domain-containing protein [candidate division NC10 bacterium]